MYVEWNRELFEAVRGYEGMWCPQIADGKWYPVRARTVSPWRMRLKAWLLGFAVGVGTALLAVWLWMELAR